MHRNYLNDAKNENSTIVIDNNNLPYILPETTYVSGKIPLIKWEMKNKITHTLLYNIRNNMTYTEPYYMSWMKEYLNIYENQYLAARDIIEYYECGCNEVILAAEMQSGKTGTVRYLIHYLLHISGNDDSWEERMQSDRIYFICGMNDNDLRQQAVNEFKGLLSPTNILFSKQLQKWNTDPPPASNCVSVIIIDESHYAGQINSQVDKFLRNTKHCNPLILSVSATAMAEMAMSKYHDKGTVYLRPSTGYYGIKDLFDNNMIYQSCNISTNHENFIGLISKEHYKQELKCNKKYNIIRLPNQFYTMDAKKSIEELGMNIKYLNYHSNLDESEDNDAIDISDFNNIIDAEPEMFTIIWIYGSLRAGKQLNTKHIGFVHDTSLSSPDTIAQSLMGRILGYGKQKHEVTCYTDIKSALLIKKWFSNMYDVTKIPQGSKCIINGYGDKVIKWELHPPILVCLDCERRAHYRSLKQLHSNRYPYKYSLFEDIIDSADGTQKAELIRILSEYEVGPGGGLMALTEDNARRSYAEHWIGNYNNYLRTKPVRGFNTEGLNKGKYYYVYANLDINSLQYGAVLITYKEFIGINKGNEHILVNHKSRFR